MPNEELRRVPLGVAVELLVDAEVGPGAGVFGPGPRLALMPVSIDGGVEIDDSPHRSVHFRVVVVVVSLDHEQS